MKIKLSVTYPNEIVKALMEEQNLVTENEAVIFIRGFYENEFLGKHLEVEVEGIEESEDTK